MAAELGTFDPVLDSLVRTGRARMVLEFWDWPREQVADMAQKVIEEPAGVQRFKLEGQVIKALALSYLEQEDAAVDLLEEAFEGYVELLQIANAGEQGDLEAKEKWAAEHDISSLEAIRAERFRILNTIGFLERERADFAKAEAVFERSFKLSSQEEDLRWKASAATQLGTVLYYRGRIPEAYDWLRLGLNLRRQLGIPDQIGFGLAALGKLQRETDRLNDARRSFKEALRIWRDQGATKDIATMLFELGYVEAMDDMEREADKLFEEAERLCTQEDSLGALIPNLREKQGKSYLLRSRRAPDETQRQAILDKAYTLLKDGEAAGLEKKQHLYRANCLVSLCRWAELTENYDLIQQWEIAIREYEQNGKEFGPVYADLEQVLGDVAYHRSVSSDHPEQARLLFDEAVDHYLRMFLYLVEHSDHLYRSRREFLGNWLPSLSVERQKQAADRFIVGWEAHPNDLARTHPGFIRTVKTMCSM